MQTYSRKISPHRYSNIELEFLKTKASEDLAVYQKAVKDLKDYITAPWVYPAPASTVKTMKSLGSLDIVDSYTTLKDLLAISDTADPSQVYIDTETQEDEPVRIYFSLMQEQPNPEYERQMKKYNEHLVKQEKEIKKFELAVTKQKTIEETITKLEKKFNALIKKQLLGSKTNATEPV